MNGIFAVETIQGLMLFAEIRYLFKTIMGRFSDCQIEKKVGVQKFYILTLSKVWPFLCEYPSRPEWRPNKKEKDQQQQQRKASIFQSHFSIPANCWLGAT